MEKNIQTNPQQILKLQGLLLEFEHILKDVEHFKYILDRIHRYELFVGFEPAKKHKQNHHACKFEIFIFKAFKPQKNG